MTAGITKNSWPIRIRPRIDLNPLCIRHLQTTPTIPATATLRTRQATKRRRPNPAACATLVDTCLDTGKVGSKQTMRCAAWIRLLLTRWSPPRRTRHRGVSYATRRTYGVQIVAAWARICFRPPLPPPSLAGGARAPRRTLTHPSSIDTSQTSLWHRRP